MCIYINIHIQIIYKYIIYNIYNVLMYVYIYIYTYIYIYIYQNKSKMHKRMETELSHSTAFRSSVPCHEDVGEHKSVTCETISEH